MASRLRADTPEEAQARRELADRVEREGSIEPVDRGVFAAIVRAEHARRSAAASSSAPTNRCANRSVGAAAALRGMALRASSEDIAEDLRVPMLMVAGGADAVVPLDGVAR